MTDSNISHALLLVGDGLSTKSSYTYYFSSSFPSYQNGIDVEKYYKNDQITEFELSSSYFEDILNTSSGSYNYTAEYMVGQKFTEISSSSNLSFSYLNSISADIVISGVNIPLLYQGSPMGPFKDVDGLAMLPKSSAGSLASDVWIPRDASGNLMSDKRLARALSHELLHSVGLLDASSTGLEDLADDSPKFSIMSYKNHPTASRLVTELQIYDIAAIQSIYGRSDILSNDSYNKFVEDSGPFNGENRVFSIWDGGGFDEIDASQFTSNSVLIDLRPGYFSSIGNAAGVSITPGENPALISSGIQNISIAFGAYIEDAVGSSQDDFIIGNVLSNKLTGGDGDDVIYGEGFYSVYEGGAGADGDYRRITTTGTHVENAPAGIAEYVNNPSRQADHIIGGAGDDYLHGSRGDDLIVGGDDDDILVGGAGNDALDGGAGIDLADYSEGSAPITIQFDGSSTSHSINVLDGLDGMDTLTDIEKIRGTAAFDYVNVSGYIQTGINLEIDGNGGQVSDPLDVVNGSGVAAGGLKVVIGTNGNGYIGNQDGTGGQITLTDFHTHIIGSDYDDDISDDSGGKKIIDGGAGNDEISVSGTSSGATLIGGEGDDILTGGSGNDVIWSDVEESAYYEKYGVPYQGDEYNEIYGGDGADFIVSASGNNYIDAGSGNDYIKLLWPTEHSEDSLYIDTGAGNDAIWAEGAMEFIYQMRADGDHDTILNDSVNTSWGFPPRINIDLGGLSYSDVTIYWDVPSSSGTKMGDLAIVVNSTGASLFIPNVTGDVSASQGVSQDTLDIYINGDEFDSRYTTISVQFGGASAYNYGATDFEADTAPDPQDTTGTSGDDNLAGGPGDDIISGDDGDDNITASPGDDQIDGGDGTDTVTVMGSPINYIISQDGASTILEGALGTLSLSNVEAIYFIADGASYSPEDFFGYYGTSGPDVIVASSHDNIIYGLEDDDTLTGGSGSDEIYGGDGFDTAIYEGFSDEYEIEKLDSIAFYVNHTPAFGEPEEDFLFEVEAIHFSGDDKTVFLAGQTFTGTAAADEIVGGYGDDEIDGLGGDDLIIGGVGDDVIDGGADDDTAVFSGSSTDYLLMRNEDGTISAFDYAGSDGSDTLVNVEHFYFEGDEVTLDLGDLPPLGTSGDDTLTGTSRHDGLLGLAGNDTLIGGDGDDWLDGGTGADSMTGGDGDDYYVVDDAGDLVIEALDEGYDIVDAHISYTLPGNVEDLYLVGVGNLSAMGNALDNYIGGNSSDNYIAGLAGNDELDGWDGNDTLEGGAGDDYLYGSSGSDVAVFSGDQADYSIVTNSGSITIVDNKPLVDGDDGTDTLYDIETAQFQDGSTSLAVPIVLDLDGDGVSLVERSETHARFDWNGDGQRDDTGWIDSGDGFLAIDRNNNGRVDSSKELSFIGDKAGAKSDLDGLSAFDTNGDNILSAEDEQFGAFGIWQDRDGDGRFRKGEFITLEEAGITSISLAGQPVNQQWEWGDNITVNTGSFNWEDGSTGQLGDVALSYDRSGESWEAAPFGGIERWGGVGDERNFALHAARQLTEALAVYVNDNWSDGLPSLFGRDGIFDDILAAPHHRRWA